MHLSILMYNGDLKPELVWILNGQKEAGLRECSQSLIEGAAKIQWKDLSAAPSGTQRYTRANALGA